MSEVTTPADAIYAVMLAETDDDRTRDAVVITDWAITPDGLTAHVEVDCGDVTEWATVLVNGNARDGWVLKFTELDGEADEWFNALVSPTGDVQI